MIRIKELREAKGLNQKQLGDMIGASQNTISNWERGMRQPDVETISDLANYFNVSVDYLLGRDTETSGSSATDIKNPAKLDSGGVTDLERRNIELFRAASPELQAAAVAMLEAAEKARLARGSSEAKK